MDLAVGGVEFWDQLQMRSLIFSMSFGVFAILTEAAPGTLSRRPSRYAQTFSRRPTRQSMQSIRVTTGTSGRSLAMSI